MPRLLVLMFLVVLLSACRNHKEIKKKIGDRDSIYFRNLKFSKLNEFVTYHINKLGEIHNDTGIIYRFKPLGTYYYLNNVYERFKRPKVICLSAKEVTSLLLTDTFSHQAGFDGF